MLAVVLLVALVLIAALAAVPTPSSAAQSDVDAILVVQDASSGRTLLGVPVENGTNVSLIYTHSVEKTRVVDAYAVRGDRLEMTRMEFSSFGAGLPAQADVHRTANGTYAFDPPGSYEEIYVTPGRVAGHRLRVGTGTYDLVALSNASTVRVFLADCDASGDGATASDHAPAGQYGAAADRPDAAAHRPAAAGGSPIAAADRTFAAEGVPA